MSIDKDTVKHISKLARISLDENKISNLSKDLSSIMKFIEKLNELNSTLINNHEVIPLDLSDKNQCLKVSKNILIIIFSIKGLTIADDMYTMVI